MFLLFHLFNNNINSTIVSTVKYSSRAYSVKHTKLGFHLFIVFRLVSSFLGYEYYAAVFSMECGVA